MIYVDCQTHAIFVPKYGRVQPKNGESWFIMDGHFPKIEKSMSKDYHKPSKVGNPQEKRWGLVWQKKNNAIKH